MFDNDELRKEIHAINTIAQQNVASDNDIQTIEHSISKNTKISWVCKLSIGLLSVTVVILAVFCAHLHAENKTLIEDKESLTNELAEVQNENSQFKSLNSSLLAQINNSEDAVDIYKALVSYAGSYSSYSDFYCNNDVVLLKIGGKKTIYVTWYCDYPGTLYTSVSNGCVTATGSSFVQTMPVEVKGIQPGISKITFTNSKNSEKIAVLAIVLN